jgi:hypothetical protein
MRKKIILLLFTLLSGLLINVHAQSLTHSSEWRELIASLRNEDWQKANTLSLQLLNKTPDDEENNIGVALLRYMYIHAEAGLLNLRKVTKDEAIKTVQGFTGKLIILPSHPVSVKQAFNSIMMHNEKTDSLFITSTNNAATQIFSFEYIVLDDKWSVEDFKNSIGKIYRLGGRLKSISVEGNMLPRFRIIIDQGIANSEEH